MPLADTGGPGEGHDFPSGGAFPATHWTEIAAIQGSASVDAARALENLCRTYLPAIERYLRCFTNVPGDPHEVANEFLAQFIHQDSLKRVDRNKGRFRNYLAAAIRHFVASQWRRRGRGIVHVEWVDGMPEPTLDPVADSVFDRGFAEILVGNAVRRTKEHFAGRRIESQIPILLPYLGSDPPKETLREAARRLEVTEDVLYQNIRRLRVELFRQLRAETRRHLGPEDDVEAEMQALLRAYASE